MYTYMYVFNTYVNKCVLVYKNLCICTWDVKCIVSIVKWEVSSSTLSEKGEFTLLIDDIAEKTKWKL